MKVLFPVTRQKDGHTIMDTSVYSAKQLCIYQSGEEKFEWLTPEALCANAGNLSLALRKHGISSVISAEMPLLALRLFEELGISVFKPEGDSLQENISLLLKQGLSKLTQHEAQPMFGCSSACSSCDSDCS